jgi:hypothetical protein
MLKRMKMNEENNKKIITRMTRTMTCIRKMTMNTKKDGKMLKTQHKITRTTTNIKKDNEEHQEV